MLLRVTPLFFLAIGLTVPSLWAEEKKADQDTHEGRIVKVAGNKLTMVDKEGKNEFTATLAPDATITCDAKECKLVDLKPGLRVIVTTKKGDAATALKVEAFTKDK
jgi:hypothetical protein